MSSPAIACPICGGELDLKTVQRLGLDEESIKLIDEKAKNGSLLRLLRMGEAVEPLIEPEKLAVEAKVLDLFHKMRKDTLEMVREVANAEQEKRSELLKDYEEQQVKAEQDVEKKLKEIHQGIGSIREKIVGTGIGKIGEMATIRELQSAFKNDEFMDKHADEKGTDIVAEVKEDRKSLGKIVISVKYQDRWLGDFLRQLKENKEEERTQWGILVTKVFPANALNDHAILTDDGDFVVKPEYVCMAYCGLRYAIKVKWEESQRIPSEEEAMRREQMMIGVLQDWVRGIKFQILKKKLDQARKAAEATQKIVKDWQRYSKSRGDEIIERGDTILSQIAESDELLKELTANLRQVLTPVTEPLALQR